jgi:hypothetical protein
MDCCHSFASACMDNNALTNWTPAIQQPMTRMGRLSFQQASVLWPDSYVRGRAAGGAVQYGELFLVDPATGSQRRSIVVVLAQGRLADPGLVGARCCRGSDEQARAQRDKRVGVAAEPSVIGTQLAAHSVDCAAPRRAYTVADPARPAQKCPNCDTPDLIIDRPAAQPRRALLRRRVRSQHLPSGPSPQPRLVRKALSGAGARSC